MPTAVGAGGDGSGRARTSRSSVLRLARTPRTSHILAPARPANARPIFSRVERRRSGHRPCRRVTPGICSANVRFGHSASADTKRRSRKTSIVRRPVDGRSVNDREYRPCTLADHVPHAGQSAPAASERMVMRDSPGSIWRSVTTTLAKPGNDVPAHEVTLTTHDQTMSITLLSRCDLGAAHVAMRYRTTNLSQIRIRRTKPTLATPPRRRADVTRPAPTGAPPSRTWNCDRLAAPCAEPVVAQHGRARGALPAHVTRYWARPDIAYLPAGHRSGAAAVRAGVAEGGGGRAHPGPGRDHP